MRTLALALSIYVTACTTDVGNSRQVADRLAHSDELAQIVANAERISTLSAADGNAAQITALTAENDPLAARARANMPDLACLADDDGKDLLAQALAARATFRLADPCTNGCQQTLATEMGFCLILSETGIGFLLCAAAATASNLACIASCNNP